MTGEDASWEVQVAIQHDPGDGFCVIVERVDAVEVGAVFAGVGYLPVVVSVRAEVPVRSGGDSPSLHRPGWNKQRAGKRGARGQKLNSRERLGHLCHGVSPEWCGDGVHRRVLISGIGRW